MRPRIFVSSVVTGFEEFRLAAREAIRESGGSPILAEDSPSSSESPRNACLDLVRTSEAVVVIVANRAGFTAPSGKAVVEEELDEARRLGRLTLAFIQDGPKEPAAERLADRVSDYTKGRLRNVFSTPEELNRQIVSALEGVIHRLGRPPRDPQIVDEAVLEMRADRLARPRVRFAFAPEIDDTLIDVLELEDRTLHRKLLLAAHEVDFFDFSLGGKNPGLEGSKIIVREEPAEGSGEGSGFVVDSEGLILLEKEISRREGSRGNLSYDMSSSFEIVAADLKGQLAAGLEFFLRILDLLDPYQRFPIWIYNVALGAIGMRSIVDEPSRASTFTAAMFDAPTIAAHSKARTITREALQDALEADRLVRLLRRGIKDARKIP